MVIFCLMNRWPSLTSFYIRPTCQFFVHWHFCILIAYLEVPTCCIKLYYFVYETIYIKYKVKLLVVLFSSICYCLKQSVTYIYFSGSKDQIKCTLTWDFKKIFWKTLFSSERLTWLVNCEVTSYLLLILCWFFKFIVCI